MSATFLVTGFEPFKEHRTNSSWDALQHLRASWPNEVVTRLLPVDHAAAHLALRRALDELEPHVVLCTGLAQGHEFRMERRAHRPLPEDLLTPDDAPALALGRWPWAEMRDALDASGVAARESLEAGRYVCESTYWSLLTHQGASRPAYAAFLHVPHESHEYPIARIADAVARVIDARRTALRRERDGAAERPPGGSPHGAGTAR